MIKEKKILLGVCGSIAAYKAAILVRSLVKSGAEVRVIMTDAAQDFITPLTLSTLSKNSVYHSFITESGTWQNHVELGLWADIMIIAPISAHSLSKFANGICNDLLTATYLSARCPVMLAPAMDLDMFQHPSTQNNLNTLKSFGNIIIDPESGELASGLSGQGRMAEPETIVAIIETHFSKETALSGKQILITAGPTVEDIDPVRFITNASSGKMGYMLAEKAAELGAEVHLVSGPTNLKVQHSNIRLVSVRSTEQMYQACLDIFPSTEIAIMAAAVADYKPKHKSQQKIKKTEQEMVLELEKTEDIAASLGGIKKSNQLLIGFALETQNEIENAKKKLASKNLDFIVLNSLNDKGAGFGVDTNKIKILERNSNQLREYSLKSKQEVATDILQVIMEKLNE